MGLTSPGYAHRLATPLAVALLLAALAPASAQDAPSGWTDRQKEDFLRTAEVTDVETLDLGVTGSKKVTLESQGEVHHAHVQTVNITKYKQRVGSQTVALFRDNYKYNIAAYRLDRMLGLGMVPVSVPRRYEQDKAALTWWIEDVRMNEKERVSRGLHPPRLGPWQDQVSRALVFDRLVYNTDWNMGNLLITDDWKIRLIDFTRAFRTYKRVREPEKLRRIDADLLARLRALDGREVREQLKDVLTGPEIKAIMARRDAIVKLFDERIEAHGLTAVLYGDGPLTESHQAGPTTAES